MSATVYAWPPVGWVKRMWTRHAPISRSRSLISGRDYTSSAERERWKAMLTVQPRSGDQMGAGYMEVLKRLVAGGEGLVRLSSPPITSLWEHKADAAFRTSVPVTVQSGGVDVDVETSGTTVYLISGGLYPAVRTTDGSWPALQVSGLPASTLVARPGDFVTAYTGPADLTGLTRQVMRPATTNASGVALIRLVEELPDQAYHRASLGMAESAVFRPVSIPEVEQDLVEAQVYTWEFLQVFADEVPGGFVEVDPWT